MISYRLTDLHPAPNCEPMTAEFYLSEENDKVCLTIEDPKDKQAEMCVVVSLEYLGKVVEFLKQQAK